jgi:hypothetical protein
MLEATGVCPAGVQFLLLRILVISLFTSADPDATYADDATSRIAFGSCHKNQYVSLEKGIIWETIGKMNPEAFLWTGMYVRTVKSYRIIFRPKFGSTHRLKLAAFAT